MRSYYEEHNAKQDLLTEPSLSLLTNNKPQSNRNYYLKSITMNQQPLLPLYENETPEEEAARLRRIKEMRDAQPHRSDDPCTALSKWLARNSRAIGTFGFVSALLVGMRELHQASLVTQDVSDLSHQPNRQQQQYREDVASTFAREVDLAEARRQLAVDDAFHAPNGHMADLSNQLDEEELIDYAETNLLNHDSNLTGSRALLSSQTTAVNATPNTIVYSLLIPTTVMIFHDSEEEKYFASDSTLIAGTRVRVTGLHLGGTGGDGILWWQIVRPDKTPLGWIQCNIPLQRVPVENHHEKVRAVNQVRSTPNSAGKAIAPNGQKHPAQREPVPALVPDDYRNDIRKHHEPHPDPLPMKLVDAMDHPQSRYGHQRKPDQSQKGPKQQQHQDSIQTVHPMKSSVNGHFPQKNRAESDNVKVHEKQAQSTPTSSGKAIAESEKREQPKKEPANQRRTEQNEHQHPGEESMHVSESHSLISHQEKERAQEEEAEREQEKVLLQKEWIVKFPKSAKTKKKLVWDRGVATKIELDSRLHTVVLQIVGSDQRITINASNIKKITILEEKKVSIVVGDDEQVYKIKCDTNMEAQEMEKLLRSISAELIS